MQLLSADDGPGHGDLFGILGPFILWQLGKADLHIR